MVRVLLECLILWTSLNTYNYWLEYAEFLQ